MPRTPHHLGLHAAPERSRIPDPFLEEARPGCGLHNVIQCLQDMRHARDGNPTQPHVGTQLRGSGRSDPHLDELGVCRAQHVGEDGGGQEGYLLPRVQSTSLRETLWGEPQCEEAPVIICGRNRRGDEGQEKVGGVGKGVWKDRLPAGRKSDPQ